MYKRHQDFAEYRPVASEQLDAILESKVVDVSGLTEPIIIEKIELLFNCGIYFVRTMAKDGLVGIAPSNDRVSFAIRFWKNRLLRILLEKTPEIWRHCWKKSMSMKIIISWLAYRIIPVFLL